ncbi:HTTM domain-containing protein [Jonesia quinghaiensis]|uniref:HTTM domain-containing protein n=1 Tax=Jonesia quinghaiensis TaxID=262806 RepID=UPI00041FC6BA|nr:HTTM domain-containing protein [Jonesia quinghaiensis]
MTSFVDQIRWWRVVPQVVRALGSPHRLFMLARAIIAGAQLSIYALTPLDYLTAQVGGVTREMHCSAALSSWNLVCSPLPAEVVQVFFIVALLFVMSGFVPRFGALVHLYIALATVSGLTLIDGGESAAVVALTWIAVICLFDHRINGWSRTPPTYVRQAYWWHGLPRAATVALQLQCSVLYLHSAISKLGTGAWVDGTALYYIVRMDMFGVSGPLGDIALVLTAQPVIELVLTYGVLAAEVFIAVIIWWPGRVRYTAVLVSVALHLAIIALLGIGSFGLIMIGFVLATAAGRDHVLGQRNENLLARTRNKAERKFSHEEERGLSNAATTSSVV